MYLQAKTDRRIFFKICYTNKNTEKKPKKSVDLKARNPFNTRPQQIAENAQIAQLVEQRTENPRVPGSIPGLGTIIPKPRSEMVGVFWF